MKKNFVQFFFLIVCAIASAETFRVKKIVAIDLEISDVAKQFDVGINDSFAIFFPADVTFVDGVEIKIGIPDEVSEWQDCVALSMYKNISPRPKSSVIDYTGERAFVKPLPARASWILQVPLSKSAPFETSAYVQKIDFIPDVKSGFLFVRFQPAMKGIPEETFASRLKIAVTPILKNKGKLFIDAKFNEKRTNDFLLFVDENKIENVDSPITLSSGNHTVSLISDSYRNEVRTIRIEKAKTTTLSISLKSSAPTLKVSSPKNARVFLDDRALTKFDTEMEISEGEHRLRFVLDDYEVMKTLHVQKGKTYSANLSIGIDIVEE